MKQVQIVCAAIVGLCFLATVVEGIPLLNGIPHPATLGGALALGSMILEPVASAIGAAATENVERTRKG